jgi:hypothetical protein
MTASPPTLAPGIRQIPFADYEALSAAEIARIDRQIEEFKHSRTIECPTSKLYFKMMTVLRERRRLISIAGDLLAGGELDILIRQISDFFLESKLYVGKSANVNQIQYQYEHELAHLHEREDKWYSELDQITIRRDIDEARLGDLTRTTIKTYDGSIPGSLPTEFTRLSPDLLNLREKERHLIGSRRFVEADALHKEFIQRQEQELVRRRQEYFEHFENMRTQVERRNTRKITALKADWDRKVDHLKHLMNAELRPLREAVENLLRKWLNAKSEYIGEDDPILKGDQSLTRAQQSGNLFRVSEPTYARNATPRTIVSNRRCIEREKALMSTRRMAETMRRQNERFDRRRWIPTT